VAQVGLSTTPVPHRIMTSPGLAATVLAPDSARRIRAAPTGVAVPSDKVFDAGPAHHYDQQITVKVYGAALAPGAAGLYQIAIQVPATLVDGDWPPHGRGAWLLTLLRCQLPVQGLD